MRVLNIGSLNTDHVYSVERIVQAGETILAHDYAVQIGGKGLNQAIALARAGAEVAMAGAIGPDGSELLSALLAAGVNTTFIEQSASAASGHALIQVASDGANSIVVYGGANEMVTRELVDRAIGSFQAGDFLLLQNETSNVDYALEQGKRRGLIVVFNPSPVNDALLRYPLELVDIFILNEIEAQALIDSPGENEPGRLLDGLHSTFPSATIVLTLGKDGVVCQSGGLRLAHSAYDVPVVDTTAAGDTFCGYFIACLANGSTIEKSLEHASQASALAVGKKGASSSIPSRRDLTAIKNRMKK
jgi:ribokinase